MSVTPHYLSFICTNIVFLTQSLLMDICDEDLDFDIHDFLKQGIANKDHELLKECFDIFGRKILFHCDKRPSKLRIEHKVNFLILYEYFLKEKMLKKPNLNYQNLIDSISDDDHDLAKNVRNLLTYYYKRDKKSFFKESKKIIKKSKREGIPINDWLIFQRYMKYKEFKEIFN